ncbi:unnamed protein product [Phyllotreta striolata]|uniref:Medium-chain acyl-CoA ligase ACSF2, mitochondrial n=1 Tax=Phyllotreta striolata TaxID=444603 RepID=A0A9N9XR42_PHYSR|nr:unnamed protein product [Phyllotreta striolata]
MKRLIGNKTILYQIIRKHSQLSYVHNIGTEPLRPLTVGRLLERTATEHGTSSAVISCHQNVTLTFRELLDRADRLAGGLRRLGLRPGDKIALWAPNMAEWYLTFMACARGGFVMVPVNPFYLQKELEYSLKKADVSALIYREESLRRQNFVEIVRKIWPETAGNCRSVPTLRKLIVIGDGKTCASSHTFNEVLDSATSKCTSTIKKEQDLIRADDPCCIQFTSGTTGFSKAPIVSHFSIVNNGYFIGKRNRLNQKHHTLCIQNPLFHAYGSVIGLIGALNHGTTVVLPTDAYDPQKNLNAIKQHACTVVYGTPTMYVDLVNLQKQKREKLQLEIAVSGGAICTPNLFESMKEVLQVREVKSIYGLTESSGSTFQSLDGDDKYQCTRTVGYLQEHLEAKIVDGANRIVPRGTVGELCVRGYSLFLSYYGDEAKTKEVKEDNGWFHTGDLALLNQDGYAEIVSRLKDMIIRGGENIYPREIEDLLDTHPDVIEAQVVGLPHERLGEEVCACLRTKDNKQLTVEDVKEFCAGTIASFKVPTVVKIMAAFPQTQSGKVQKMNLVKMLTNK